MNMNRIIAGLILLGAGIVIGADWPQWGGDNSRNLVSKEKNLPDVFVPVKNAAEKAESKTPTNVKWVARLGGAAYGNATIANGRVFIGTDDQTVDEDSRFTRTQGGMMKCFDEKTGKLLWQLVVPKRTDFGKELHYGYQSLGVCSSPAVEGDRVYIMSSAAEILCLDVKGQADGNEGPFTDEGQYLAGAKNPPVKLKETDADIIWRYDLMKELKVCPHDATACSVLIHGDFLYVSTCNGVDHPHLKMLNPDAPALIVLNKKTGKLVAMENEKISTRVFHCQWSPPGMATVGGKDLVLFGGADGICYAFEPLEKEGDQPVFLKKAWSVDADPPEYRTRDGQAIVYIKGDKRKKDSPNKNDGSYVGPSEIIGTPVFVDGRVYVTIGQDPLHGRARGAMTCIDASKPGEASVVWRYDGMDRSISSPAVADGLVYVPDIGGRLHCVDAATGKPVWVFETKSETWGSALVADGKVFFGTQKDFYIMAAGKEMKMISKTALGSPIYSTPVAANATLYVASQRYLWAVGKE